jgi:hypothetical protein
MPPVGGSANRSLSVVNFMKNNYLDNFLKLVLCIILIFFFSILDVRLNFVFLKLLLQLHRINGVSDFVHRPDSKELEDKNTTFLKLDLRTETDPVSETSCSLTSNSLESGRWTKSENPLILCAIHHHKNPIEST